MTHHNNIFRKEALLRVASPEQLDQLVQVVSPKRWFSLAALGALVVTGFTWSVFGRIPMTVAGRGVLIYPSQVVSVQSSTSGRILSINVQVGDLVKKGQVLATIDQSELQKQLQLARNKLAQLRLQDRSASSMQTQRSTIDESAIAQQRQTLQQSLQTVQSLTPVLREKGLNSIQQSRKALQQRLQTLRETLPTYKKRWEDRHAIFVQGAVSKDTILQAQQDYLNAQAQINDAESQLKQLDLKEADAQREYLRNVNQVNELKTQLKSLDSRKASLAEQDFTTATNRSKEIQETERSIAQLELQLQKNTQIVSDYTGRILEITAKGQQLEPGAGIGT